MQHLYLLLKNKTYRAEANFSFNKDVHDAVRLNEGYQIKPHAPPLVRAPVNSFKFQPCDRTTQADYLTR
jgi:hypothetical protein